MSEEVVREMTVEEMIEQNKTYLGFIESRYKEMQKRCEKLNERSEYIELNSYGEGIKKGEQLMQEKANKIVEFWKETDWEETEELFGRSVIYGSVFKNINEYYNKIIEYEKNKEQEEKEIHVGDELVGDYGFKYIVTKLDGKEVCLVDKHGDIRHTFLNHEAFTKTGKHYPIDEMLKELDK